MSEKSSSGIVKLALILAAICIVVSAILGGVNMITKGKIEDFQKQKTDAAFASVLPKEENEEYIELNDFSGNPAIDGVWEAPDGHIVQLTIGGAQSNITLVVGVDSGGAVTGVSIISHGETPGLGAKATEDSFRNQYIGIEGSAALTKAGGTIDALTGATITSQAMTDAVNIALDAVATLG